MLATAGLSAFAVTQSMPSITSETVPLPRQPSTFTPVSGAPGRRRPPSVVVFGRHGPGRVRAVAVAVGVPPTGEVDVVHHVEVRVSLVDPGVDDVGVDV